MKAEVGDRIVVASGTLHRPIRDGEILHKPEQMAVVRTWCTGPTVATRACFPGPDAHVEHVQRENGGTGGQ